MPRGCLGEVPCGGRSPSHSAFLAESEPWWKLGLKSPLYPRTVPDGQSPLSLCGCVCVCLSVCLYTWHYACERKVRIPSSAAAVEGLSSTLIDTVGQ